VVFPALLNRFKWFTGGELGPRPTAVPSPPGWLPFDIPENRTFGWLHLIVVAIAVVVAWLLANLRSSATGRAVRAAAQHTDAAAAMGVDVTRVGTVTFGLSTALAALGGALIAMQTQAVTSARFDVFRSLALYAMVAVCGAGSMVGASLAAVAFVGTPWLMTELDLRIGAAGVPPDAPGGGAYLIWGLALVVTTMVAPEGLVPAIGRRLRRVVMVVEPDEVGLTAAPSAAGHPDEVVAANLS
jgi:ABC-type branched-subunit amino acid transport system permease subunit